MLTLRPRLAVAGVAAVAALAVPAAALASGSGSPPAKPSPTAPAASKPATGPSVPAPAAAASWKAAARRAQGRGGGPSIASALASQLRVSDSVAQHTIAQLEALGRGGVDPASPAFAAIAHGLGVGPARLAAALAAAKMSLAGQ